MYVTDTSLEHGYVSFSSFSEFLIVMLVTPSVVALATNSALFEKTISNVKEVKARGAVVFGLAQENREHIEDTGDYIFEIPQINENLIPSLSVVPLQLFGYYVASLKGCDIDKPRNLAKSVTDE